MKTMLMLLSIALFCTSCAKSKLEVLLDTLQEETMISAIDFARLSCAETLNNIEMRYLEFPQRVEEARGKSQLIVKAVEEFQLIVDDIREEESENSIHLDELISMYNKTLVALEDQIPEGWEGQYSETSRDYYLKSYSKTQLERIALMMHNDIVLNEAFVLKALYNYVDWSD